MSQAFRQDQHDPARILNLAVRDLPANDGGDYPGDGHDGTSSWRILPQEPPALNDAMDDITSAAGGKPRTEHAAVA
jgi:hypothetical protein